MLVMVQVSRSASVTSFFFNFDRLPQFSVIVFLKTLSFSESNLKLVKKIVGSHQNEAVNRIFIKSIDFSAYLRIRIKVVLFFLEIQNV